MALASRPLVPSRLSVVLGHRERGVATTRVAGFIALTKPRIIELLLVTTIPAMIVAADGWPGTWLTIATLVGGTLAAGGANAINMVVDRDIDRIAGIPLTGTFQQPLRSFLHLQGARYGVR